MATKSFLRWAGSKQKLLPHLKEYWEEGHIRYIEPFMGSAKLFFSLDINEAILSDTNSELVDTFNQIKKNPYPVYKILKSLKVSKTEYYKIRAVDPKSLGRNQRAARFIYLNKLCFNGLYRTNSNGKFNVPYSHDNLFDLKTEIEILKVTSKKLTNAKIICGDFEQIVRSNLAKGDFVYLDPPYAVENRRIFKQYGPHTFGLDDLKRLNELLYFIDKKGAKFLLSYAFCKEAFAIFSKWPHKKRVIQRNISGFAKYRRKAVEVLFTNTDS